MAGKTEIKNFNNELSLVNKILIQQEKALTAIIASLSELNKSLIQGQATQKNTAKNTKKITELQKERIRVANQLKKMADQSAALQEKNTKILKKAQIEYKNKIAAIKKEIINEKASKKAKEELIQKQKEAIRQRKLEIAEQKKYAREQTKIFKNSKEGIRQKIIATEKTKALTNEVKKSLGITKQQTSFTDKLSKSYQNTILKLGLYAAAISGVIKGIKSFTKRIIDINKQTSKTAAIFKLSRTEAKSLTKEIRALSSAYDQEFNEVLKSANVLSKEFGITGSESLNLINEGFEKGANVNGEFLELLKEYPAQLKAVGLNAEETIAIITQTERAGIFSDKGIDAIKEAGIRLRELTPATVSALDAIGLSSKEIEKSLRNGSKSLFEVTQQVSNQLSKLPPQSKEVGQAIADIFGGPGEDAGLTFLTSLGDINIELSDIGTTLSDVEKSQADLTKEWSLFIDDIVTGDGDISKLLSNFMQGLTRLTSALRIFNETGIFLGPAKLDQYYDDIEDLTLAYEGSIKRRIELGKLDKDQASILLDEKFTKAKEAEKKYTELVENEGGRRNKELLLNSKAQIEAINQVLLKYKEVSIAKSELSEEESKNAKKTKIIFDEQKEYFESIKAEEVEDAEFAAKAMALANSIMNQQKKESEEDYVDFVKEKTDEIIDGIYKEEEAFIGSEDKKIEKLNERIGIASEIGSQLFDIGQTFRDNEMISLENNKARELKLAGDNEKKKEKIEEKYAKKVAELNTKQAKSDKAQSIFNATINTASAITKALTLGLPGIPLAIVMGVLGAVQVAAIAAQPIPKFKDGTGALKTDTLAWVGDGGVSEVVQTADNKFYQTPATDTLVNLPKGSQVYPSVENFINNTGGISTGKMDELISVSRRNKPTVINNSLNITREGWVATQEKSDRIIKRRKYFRS